MKKQIILLVAAFIIMLGACNNSSNKSNQKQGGETTQDFKLDTLKLKSGDTFYQCEMDPEVISDKQGACPKCGMELIVMKKH